MEDDNTIKQAIGGKINFGTTRLTNKKFACEASAKQSYYNLTQENLIISFRDGSYMIVEPDGDHQADGAFYIAHERTSRNTIKVIDSLDNPLSELIRSRINEKSQLRDREFYFEESISIKEIKNAPYGVYLRISDICVTLESQFNIAKAHPFCSQRSEYLTLNQLDDFNSATDISVGLRLINNNGIKQTKYCVFQNRVLVLKSKMSMTSEPGFYITGLIDSESDGVNSVRKDVFYPLEKAMTDDCPVRLFDSSEEASSHLMFLSSEDKKLELEITRTKKDSLLLAAENQLKDQENKLREYQCKQEDFERDRLERIEEVRRLQMEQTLSKARYDHEIAMATMKEQYAIESMKSKNQGEAIKLVGIAVAATATIMKILG